MTIPFHSMFVVVLACGLAACGSSSSGSDSSDPATGAGGTTGGGGESSAGGNGSGGTSAAGAGGYAGSGGMTAGGGGVAGGGGSGGQSAGSCDIPSDANSCIGSGGLCQSYWGAYTAATVMQVCKTPNTFLAGACPTASLAAICVYGSNPSAGASSLSVSNTLTPAQQAGLKSQCEAGMGTWCPL